jgi:hypothetical protein
MIRIRSVFCFVAVLVMAVGFGGCNSSSTGGSASNKDDLQALGGAYHAYHDSHGQGPKSADDLIDMLTDSAKKEEFANSVACKKLKSGEFVLNPGIQFRKAKDLGNTPILYEKKVPSEGGLVVLGDAVTKTMTAAEFKKLDSGDEARAESK